MLKEGFYEKIITEALSKSLENEVDKLIQLEAFNKTMGAVLIQRYFQEILNRAFNQISTESEDKATKNLIDLTNNLVKLIASQLNDKDFEDELITHKGELLKAFFNSATFPNTNLKEYIDASFPLTGLSESALFNGSKHTPSLESELKKEMLTSDEIWWLVSFLKFEGVRLFEQVLRKLESTGKKVKIICTVYMGATDLKAIDFLSEFSNVEIKISFNTNQERLHAKSYLFIRNTGFHTAYIGSSNLSRSALTNGLEWNVKVTQQEIPHIISKCKNTFDTYWNDANFELYNAELHREKLKQALDKGNPRNDKDEITKFFDLSPFPFQQQILDQLSKCRQRGENKNLVVAATGTGKTVIAAFDFKQFLKNNPQANFLFVAHREEILRQARYTFRQVLKNNDFGELWFSGENPSSYKQLFVSIQTINNRIETLNVANDFYDYIIVDEVHHSAASSYQKLLSHFSPNILLGLTATPERHDGSDIKQYFSNSISAELRLPEALNKGLLCPFQYFGINDETDLSGVSWSKGRYEINALEKIFTEDNRRVTDIIRNCDKYLTDYKDVRTLGFCVSKKHAEFMSIEFNKKGFKAAYLHSEISTDRNAIIQQLRRKEINYLFVVDMLNEGVDIPEIDTLLFLRPTESLTIFLQQLGRGLRLCEDKSGLTVLDFVGQQHKEYNFEHKFRALIGKTRSKIKDELEHDFPNLPLGCSITLEETAKEKILKNIQRSYGGGERSILRAISQFKQDYDTEISIKNFCDTMDIHLAELYKSKKLFHELNKTDEKIEFKRSPYAEKIASVMGNSWLTSDSESYFRFLIDFVSNKHKTYNEQYLLMCYFDIFDKEPKMDNIDAVQEKLKEIFEDIELKNEVLEYLNYRLEQLECIEKDIDLKLPSVLKLHGRYTRKQIFCGLSENGLNNKVVSQSGVHRIKINAGETELLFVTLYKDETKFSASTMYHDYFISSDMFHWQSQNSTAPESNVGQSYIRQREQNKDVLLFIREATKDENGLTMGYVFCGKLHYLQHEGRKPMSITWRIETPPPALLLDEGRKLGIG